MYCKIWIAQLVAGEKDRILHVGKILSHIMLCLKFCRGSFCEPCCSPEEEMHLWRKAQYVQDLTLKTLLEALFSHLCIVMFSFD